MSRARVVLLRGLPGIGKTTVAAILRERMVPSVRVSVDTIRYFAVPRDLNEETIEAAERAASALAMSYANDGFTVFVEGVFANVDTVGAITSELAAGGVEASVVTLSGSLDDALARNSARNPNIQLDPERIRFLHAQFDDTHGHVIDTSERVAEEVAEFIEERLAAPAGPPPPSDRSFLLFLRHGSAAVKDETYPDPWEVGLAEKGRRQILGIRRGIQRLAPELIVCSPFARARESAELLNETLGLPLEFDEEWRERTFPEFYGRSYEEIAAQVGAEIAEALRTNGDEVQAGGESLSLASERVNVALNRLLARPERRILVVSHGGPHGWICSRALGSPSPHSGRDVTLDPARMSVFEPLPNGLRIQALNALPGALAGLR
jgi:probable phosphoglycerate mutase